MVRLENKRFEHRILAWLNRVSKEQYASYWQGFHTNRVDRLCWQGSLFSSSILAEGGYERTKHITEKKKRGDRYHSYQILARLSG